jgi:hypothetical protein
MFSGFKEEQESISRSEEQASLALKVYCSHITEENKETCFSEFPELFEDAGSISSDNMNGSPGIIQLMVITGVMVHM